MDQIDKAIAFVALLVGAYLFDGGASILCGVGAALVFMEALY